jgi:hypothetical protein
MKRLCDVRCSLDHTFEAMCDDAEVVLCPEHNIPCEQLWWQKSRSQQSEWHPSEWATVFKKPDGTFSFPARADKATPPGCERIVLKSDRDFARVEQAAGVRSERRWHDSGSGRAFDSETPGFDMSRSGRRG